ncbi:hypothetical protein [Luteolibacter sp. AS25]|uniref:hypothetical protein n=1 Tax=Luteolibacter sp. AS25 TaxID=3135776 RepID=UPI00398ADEB5
MVKILGIATAVILAVAALVAVKNKSQLEAEIGNRDSRERELAKSQERLTEAQEVLRALPVEIEQVNTLAEVKAEEEVAAKEINDTLQADISTRTEDVDTKAASLNIVREKAATVGNIENLAGNIRGKRIELEELDQAITAKEASLSNMEAQTAVAQKEAKRRQNEFDLMSKGESLSTLQTRVRRVYPTWGFVTLADGNNAGVIGNSTLDVIRNGEVIGKLLVTAVESSSASASIIPDSVGPGVQIRVGDRVVPGTKVANDSASASN